MTLCSWLNCEFPDTETLSQWCQSTELFLRTVWLCFAVGQGRLGVLVSTWYERVQEELWIGRQWVIVCIRKISEEHSSSEDVDGKFRNIVEGVAVLTEDSGRCFCISWGDVGLQLDASGRVRREATQWPVGDDLVPPVTILVSRWRSWSAGDVTGQPVTFVVSRWRSWSADDVCGKLVTFLFRWWPSCSVGDVPVPPVTFLFSRWRFCSAGDARIQLVTWCVDGQGERGHWSTACILLLNFGGTI